MKTKRRFKSDRYKAWEREADKIYWCTSSLYVHEGNVAAIYTLAKPDKRRRDIGNYEKAISDYLVKCCIILDDSQIQRLTIQWGDKNEVVIEDV